MESEILAELVALRDKLRHETEARESVDPNDPQLDVMVLAAGHLSEAIRGLRSLSRRH